MSIENPRGPDPYKTVIRLHGNGMQALRELFPAGQANALNQVLFSTSGVHGSYDTIEDVECWQPDPEEPDTPKPTLTFVVIHPRLLHLKYGQCSPQTADDFAFLRQLRASSGVALAKIGWPQ
jgi:hypothetical protein